MSCIRRKGGRKASVGRDGDNQCCSLKRDEGKPGLSAHYVRRGAVKENGTFDKEISFLKKRTEKGLRGATQEEGDEAARLASLQEMPS